MSVTEGHILYDSIFMTCRTGEPIDRKGSGCLRMGVGEELSLMGTGFLFWNAANVWELVDVMDKHL